MPIAKYALALALVASWSGAVLAEDAATPTTAAATADSPIAVELANGALDAETGADQIAAISADAQVRVVLMSELQGPVTSVTVDDVRSKIEAKKGQVDALRDAIAAKPAISAALDAAGQDVAKVFAVSTTEDGTVLVFVDDGAA